MNMDVVILDSKFILNTEFGDQLLSSSLELLLFYYFSTHRKVQCLASIIVVFIFSFKGFLECTALQSVKHYKFC